MPRDYTNVINKIDLIASKVYGDLEKAEIPNIKIKYVKRKLKTLKSIKPGMMEGEFSINLHIQNKGSVELENIILKDKIPKGFNLADFTPPEGVKHEVIKTDEESELQLKIPELKGSESIKINYKCAGMGDYPRYEPEVIVQGKEIFDADTKESLGQMENRIATIKIVDVMPTMSLAKIVKGDLDKISEGLICRLQKVEMKEPEGAKSRIRRTPEGGVKLPFD